MTEKTEKNLSTALADASRWATRNQTFAQKADHEGQATTARLFRALAEADAVQARRYLALLRGKIGTTEDNLEEAWRHSASAAKEDLQRTEEALEENHSAAVSAFSQSRQAKDCHTALIRGLKEDLSSNTDLDYYVCQICGYISKSRVPDRCPVCGAIPGKFKWIG